MRFFKFCPVTSAAVGRRDPGGAARAMGLSQNSRLNPVHPLVSINSAAASGPLGYSRNPLTRPLAAIPVLRGDLLACLCFITAAVVSSLKTSRRISRGVGSRACALLLEE